MNNNTQPLAQEIATPMLPSLPLKEQGDSPIVVEDTTVQEIQFNVMPNRPVSEILRPKEYRVWHRYVESEFNREYYSSMLNSPDHLIFLTALIQVQRICYVYMCHEFQLPYKPLGPERLKIWPTDVNVEMPKMVTENKGLVHSLRITTLKTVGERQFFAQSFSDVNNVVKVRASAFIYLL